MQLYHPCTVAPQPIDHGEPGSKLAVLGMAIPPLIGNPYNGYINPYYWVDDHPRLYGNNGSLDPSTIEEMFYLKKGAQTTQTLNNQGTRTAVPTVQTVYPWYL